MKGQIVKVAGGHPTVELARNEKLRNVCGLSGGLFETGVRVRWPAL